MRYFLPAIVLLVSGLAIDPESLARWLAGDIEAVRLGSVTKGAALLQLLLIADAVILFAIGVIKQIRAGAVPMREAPQLWSPTVATPESVPGNVAVPVLVLLLVLALLLRAVGLDGDLWIDEVLTVVHYVRLPLGAILTDFSDDNQHMLFTLLSHISVAVLGESEWTVRLPSLVFGVASIWAVYRLAWLVFGQQAALWSAALLTFSYHHIWFSQNARGYIILLFFTVVATEFFLRGLQHGRWRDWIVYGLAIAAAAWAHLTGVFVAVAHGIVLVLVLVRCKGAPGALATSLFGMLLAGWFTLHLYALVLPQLLDFFTQPGGGTGVTQVDWRSPLWLVNEMLRGFGVNAALGWLGVVALLGLVAACGWWYLKRDWVFALLAVLPGVLLGTVMLALGRNLWPRMFFNEAGFVVILLVVAALAAGKLIARPVGATRQRVVTLLPVLLLTVSFALMLPKLYRYPKQDFTGAREFVLAQADVADRVVGIHMAGRVYNQYYEKNWPEINSLEELNASRQGAADLWVLYTLPGYLKSAKPDLARALHDDFDLIRTFPGTLGDGAVIVRRSKHAGNNKP